MTLRTACVTAVTLLFFIAVGVVFGADDVTERPKPRNFLQAETRVTDLISKLDAVSNHAARASDEIHSTLRELWQIVDLLGRDRCGEVVERVRVLQRKAAARVEKLERELDGHVSDMNQLKADTRARASERDEAREALREALVRAEQAQREAQELEERLKRNEADKAREGAYKTVVERLDTVRSGVKTRYELLERALNLFDEERSAAGATRSHIDSALEALQSAENASPSDATAEASWRKKVAGLQQQLRAMTHERDDSSQEVNRLQREIARVRSAGKTERVVFQDGSEGASWTGMIALCMISLASGGFIVYAIFGLSGARNGGSTPGAPAPAPAPAPAAGSVGGSPLDKYGSYTPSQRTPEGFPQPRTSPVTYLNDSSKSTPLGRTPRLY